jgi:RNA polymerase sigma factor (TIGR02999 family)
MEPAETATPALPGEVTLLLAEARRSGQEAVARLIPLVYRELRHLAGHYLQNERIGHTLQPTALVHEVYLRLLGQNRTEWQNRAHFLGVAARMMRRVLVDYARQRATRKRTGPVAIAAGSVEPGAAVPLDEILAVDEGLTRLHALDPQQSRVVELRYFGGLSVEETAEALGVSPRTVKRDWAMARAWLHAELSGEGHGE